MANTYTQILYHVVFTTKDRQWVIQPQENRDHLYAYIWGIHKQLKCRLYRIGGIPDHIHVLSSLHPALPLAKLVETIKTGSTSWMRREGPIPSWPGWQDGYGAFSVSWADKVRLIEYIKGQEQHHKGVSFLEEYKSLLQEASVGYDERYLV